MSIVGNKDCLADLSGDINAQLCTLVKLSKVESAYVANTIRALDNSRHSKSLPKYVLL